MWGLDEIIAMNKKAAVTKAQARAKALNKLKKPSKKQKREEFYGTNL